MIRTRAECDMECCCAYEEIPEGEAILEYIRSLGWATRRVYDGYVRHVCPACKDRPTEDLR